VLGSDDLVEQMLAGGLEPFDRGILFAREAVDHPGADRVDSIDLRQIDLGHRPVDRAEPIGQVAQRGERQIAGEAEDRAAAIGIYPFEIGCGAHHAHLSAIRLDRQASRS
jgi:hypothetical protein